MNDKAIWDYLFQRIQNPFGVSGLMGNLYAESGLRPGDLEGKYEKRLGMTDASYTAAVDDGSYTNFVHDAAGYGLAQWTYHTRKQALLEYARASGTSISDLSMQLDYLVLELQKDFKSVWNTLLSATSVREASDAVLLKFEKPADQSEAARERRAAHGQKYFDMFSQRGNEKMVAIEQVVSIASAEVGYLEKASNAQLDDKTANAGKANCTKYARDLDAVSWFNGRKQGAAWCAVFVTWCFYMACGKAARNMLFQPTTDNCAAGCGSARSYYNKHGRLFDTPQIGDQIFFWSSDLSSVSHTGLVVNVTDSRVYTIEGNTSDGTSVVANGGAVCKKNYPLGYKRIAGYGRPDWLLNSQAEGSEQTMPVDYSASVYAAGGKTVNLRASMSTASKILYPVPIGMYVHVIEEVSEKWARVTYDAPSGQTYTGYMMREYLRESVPAQDSSTVTMDRAKLQEIRACLADALSIVNNALGLKE